MVINSSFYMSLALKEAWKYQGLTYPNPAVGCTVVSNNGEILAVEAHKCSGAPHAEVEALKTAYIKLTNDKKISELTLSSDIHTFLLENHNNCFENICADICDFTGNCDGNPRIISQNKRISL